MTTPGRLGRSLRAQLLIHQVFAEEHYWHRRRQNNPFRGPGPSVCADPPPNPPRRNTLYCPICALSKPLTQMTVDHAPPQAGQSRLGGAAVAVLTCNDCNNSIGLHYERAAAAIQHGIETAELTAEELVNLANLRTLIEPFTPLRLLPHPVAVQMTDLKTAFLISFATLGYRWALADELRPIRRAIVAGREPGQTYALGFEAGTGSSMYGSNVVLEVGAPHPCTIVIAANGAGMVLPLPGTALIPPPPVIDEITARSYPWPQTAGHSLANEVSRAYRLGTLFHGDLCHSHEWPVQAATPAALPGARTVRTNRAGA